MDRCVTPPKRVTSPTWGLPPPCKQAPKNNPVRENAMTQRPSIGSCSLLQVMGSILLELNFNPRNIHYTKKVIIIILNQKSEFILLYKANSPPIRQFPSKCFDHVTIC